jgi:hypothetical protein
VVFAENPRLPRRGSKPRRLCKSFHSSKERLVREDVRMVMSFDESRSKLLATMSWWMAFIKKWVQRFQMTVGRVVKLSETGDVVGHRFCERFIAGYINPDLQPLS